MKGNLKRLQGYEDLLQRHLGITPYAEQYAAAAQLIKGNVVEMKTGEGKTIAVLLAALYFAQKGRKVYICTSNDYLAQRDFDYSKSLFNELGIKSAFLEQGKGGSEKIYAENSVFYAQGGTLIFDYLRGVKAEYDVALIDEIDHILVECANHDFCVSDGSDDIEIETPYYKQAIAIASLLTFKELPKKMKKADYLFDYQWGADVLIETERQSFEITESGILKLNKIMNVGGDICENLLFMEILHAALLARFFYKKDEQYIVRDDHIVIIDSANGRISPNSKTDLFLQSILEVKEGVPLTPKSPFMRSCSFPVFFSLFTTLTGLSGSVSCFTKDFEVIYKKKIVKIKEHLPSKRKLFYEYFGTEEEKIARIKEILFENPNDPILIIADNDRRAAALYEILAGERTEYLRNVNLEAEEEIIEDAKNFNSVVISSRIVGRGMDVNSKREGTKLIVILAQRFFDRSIEVQAIGRTARNGGEGSCYVLSSLTEPCCKGASQKKMKKVISENQKLYENQMFEVRKDIYIRSKLFFDQMVAVQNRLDAFKSFNDIRDFVKRVSTDIGDKEEVTELVKMLDILVLNHIPYTTVCPYILREAFTKIRKVYQQQFMRYTTIMMGQLKTTDGYYELNKGFILAGTEIVFDCIKPLVLKFYRLFSERNRENDGK